MSLYKDASLVMIPSAYKDGKLYSIRPTDGSGDFTFSRGSNLAATRVDVNGLIEKGRENLFVQSNQFDTTWILGSATITGGQSGYDGTNNAWKLQDTAVTGEHFVRQTPNVGNIVSVSVYAKANTLNFLWLRSVESGVNKRTWFDLSSGSVGTSQGIDANIESVGNGWYRCSATFNHQTAFEYYIAISDANGSSSYAGTGNGSIYIQDAQLEQGLVATDYIETGASTAQAGILEDMPRLDYSGSCPSLLLEPQRTNLITQSEYVDSWLKYNCTINSNAVVSPEGKQNAHKIVENTSLGYHAVYLNNVFTADGTYKTASVFVKAAGRNFCAISTRGAFGSSDKTLIFNLTTGEWAVNGSGQNTGLEAEQHEDGWWRIILNTNTTSAAYDGFIVGASIAGDTWADAEYTGDGSSGIYVYGAQLEQGSYPTSYIPTYGTSQTRSDDSALGQSISLGNSHTIFFNGELNTIDNNKVFMELITSSSTTSATIRNVIGTLRLYNQIDSNYPLGGIQSTNNKWVMRIDGNNYTLFYNNAGTPTSQSGTFATARDMDRINLKGGFTEYNTKQVLAFPTALSDAECKSLVQ